MIRWFQSLRRRRADRFVAALAAVAVVAAGCSEPMQEQTDAERIDQVRTELVEDGTSPEVAACVVRLARYELRLGTLDDLTRDELLVSCRRAQTVLDGDDDGADLESDPLAFVEGPNTLGDDPALDALWRACEEGSGAACDQLFREAPVGTEYEWFGVSCGDRDQVLRCSELDEEIGSDQ